MDDCPADGGICAGEVLAKALLIQRGPGDIVGSVRAGRTSRRLRSMAMSEFTKMSDPFWADKEYPSWWELRLREAEEIRKYIAQEKSVPCLDCNQNFEAPQMTFDHLRDKLFNMASARYRTLEEVKAERAKCEVVCRKCHDLRERKRGR